MKITLNLLLPVKAGRLGYKVVYLLLVLLLGPNLLPRALAQTKQETPKPEITVGWKSTFWGSGPDSSYDQSYFTLADGSGLIDNSSFYKSKKSFKTGAKYCAKDPFKVLDDSILRDAKGRKNGHRTLLLMRDSNDQESIVLCRTEPKERRVRRIYNAKLENVLAHERSQFPQ